MPKLTTDERRALTVWAVVEHAKGRTYTDIAEEAGVERRTVSGWIESEYARVSEQRSVSDARERAISGYEALLREAWRRIQKTDTKSLNSAGLINAARGLLERIDKLTGAEAPVKYQEVEDEIIIEWEDLDNPELLEAEEVS